MAPDADPLAPEESKSNSKQLKLVNVSLPRSLDSVNAINALAIQGYAEAERTCQTAAGGRGKLQRTMSSFWSGSAATDSLNDSLVGRTGSCDVSKDEVSTLVTDTVHVEDGNIDEEANELSVPCPNGSRTNRLMAGNSRAFKELEYLVVATRQRHAGMVCVQCSEFLSVFKVHIIKRHTHPFVLWVNCPLLWVELTLVRGKPLVVQGLWLQVEGSHTQIWLQN